MQNPSTKLTHRAKNQLSAWKKRIARELSNGQSGGISEGNQVQVYFDGDEAFTAMIQAIQSAQHYVHLEMYMFHSDHIGSRFAEALSAKAREGIPVRVIYDAIGSMDADTMQWARMRDAGVTVIAYRPIAFWRKRGGLLGRNHRKNLIIDGAIGFTGGMNLTDEWSAEFRSDDCWRDTHCRVIGPAAGDLNKLFIDSWEYVTEERIFHRPPPTPLNTQEKQNFREGIGGHDHGHRCIVVGSQGLRGRKDIKRLFCLHLDQAEKSIRMTMPYFVPPAPLRRSLKQARKRNIQVSVLVPRNSDVHWIDWVREGLYPRMLDWGVKILEYLGPILHAKTMVVDDQIAIIGSGNFDLLSVAMNREVAIVAFDDAIVKELDKQWQNDLSLSERVAKDWELKRPWWRLLVAKIGCFFIRRL